MQRLEHQLELPEVQLGEGALEVADPAVDQLGGAGAGPGGEVVPLDERDREASRGGVERDPSPRRAPADDEDVKNWSLLRCGGAVLEVVKGVFARREPVHEGDAGDLKKLLVEEEKRRR